MPAAELRVLRESLICTVFGKNLHTCLVLSLEAHSAHKPSLLLCLDFYRCLVRAFGFSFTSPNKPKVEKTVIIFPLRVEPHMRAQQKENDPLPAVPCQVISQSLLWSLVRRGGVGKRSDCLAIFKCSQKQKIIKEPEIPYTSIILLLRRSKAHKR